MTKSPNPNEEPPRSQIELTLHVKDERWKDQIPDVENLTQNVISKVIQYLKFDQMSIAVSIILADDPFIQEYNVRYRGKDKPTNVLSFSALEEPFTVKEGDNLGDIMVAYETMEKEAKEQNKTLKDHYTHIVVHGVLHLIGYDHEEEGEAKEMENIEIQILKILGIENPYEENL